MKKREFIIILAITLIVVVVWVVSDLIHTKSSSQGLPDVKNYTDPVNPSFDQQTLDKISHLATPAPAPSAAPIASTSPSASPSATPIITPRPTSSASPVASASASPG